MNVMTNIKSTINANGVEIRVTSSKEADYISLTDIAKKRNPEFPADVVKNWLRSRSTIEFLGLWEKINNPNLNWSNSTSLKIKQVKTALYSPLKNG